MKQGENISLNQGKYLIKKKEFENTNATTSDSTYKSSISSTESSSQDQNVTISDLVNRQDSTFNPYLGKNVRFSDGVFAYVTQKGYVKVYPGAKSNTDLTGYVNCPAYDPASIQQIDVSFSNTSTGSTLTIYLTDGNNAGKKLVLIVGTPMQPGQACGFEGQNIWVSSLFAKNTIKDIYKGCFSDPQGTAMTFVGGTSSKNYTVELCKKQAVQKGYAYYAIQNADSLGNGYCAVTNDISPSIKNGPSEKSVGKIPLWSSHTKNYTDVVSFTLNDVGQLVLLNKSS